MTDLRPTYYVRHPDGAISIAVPQPTPEQIAEQADYVFAQCDRTHGGGVCADPDCYRQKRTLVAQPPQAVQEVRMLGFELDGVIADVEQGNGFDDVCLETIKRVRAALAAARSPKQHKEDSE